MDTLNLKAFTDIIGLITSMSLSAFPLFFSIAFPFLYIILKKSMPSQLTDAERTELENANNNNVSNSKIRFKQKIVKFFEMPDLNNKIIYISLFLFVIGAIVLKIDQNNKENIRKNGLRIKEYMIQNMMYVIPKDSLKNKIFGNNNESNDMIDVGRIRKVLKNYPNDFIQVGTNIILVEPILETNSTANKLPSEQQKIYTFSVKLLERYLSSEKIKTDSSMTFETLQKINNRFTQEIIYRLITNDTIKYNYAKDSHNNELIIKRK
jgi:hypothetical protein